MNHYLFGKPARKKLEGTTVAFWEVLEYLGKCRYRCRCVCGAERRVDSQALLHGNSQSCGCKNAEVQALRLMQFAAKKSPTIPDRFEHDYAKE